jgi:uncharacterized Zn finger protein
METNIQQLKCGECGEEKHKIYRRENGEIITECIKCKSQTEIVITEPKIITRNNFGSGSLCVLRG